MKTSRIFFIFFEISIFLLAFIVSFWPLVICAILVALMHGDWPVALCFGAVADALFGTPTGTMLHSVAIPFTLGTLAAVLAWAALRKSMRSDMPDVLR